MSVSGARPGEFDELLVLIVVVPRVVRQAAFAESSHAGLERFIEVQARRCAPGDRQDLGMQRVRSGVTDAAQSTVGRVRVGGEGLVEMVGIGEVDVRDDPTHHLAVRRFGRRRDEHGLTDRSQMLGPVAPVVRVALDEDRVDDVVPRRQVGLEFGQPVRQRAALRPEVVVRIDDRQIGVDHVLDHRCQPLLGSGLHRCSSPRRHRPPSSVRRKVSDPATCRCRPRYRPRRRAPTTTWRTRR